MTLTAIAEKYGCDKLHSHSYIPVYEELFKGRTVRRLLEIGIGYEDLMKPFVPKYVHGASLRMWEEYFTEAEIYACDIREDTLVNEGRIHSFVCDQSSLQSLVDLVIDCGGGDFDVVIDDGSHVTEHQILTAKSLLPAMKSGSLYVIEDCYSDTAMQIIQELAPYVLRRRGTSLDMNSGGKRLDDNLVVIRK